MSASITVESIPTARALKAPLANRRLDQFARDVVDGLLADPSGQLADRRLVGRTLRERDPTKAAQVNRV
jgi:hypothetical protein